MDKYFEIAKIKYCVSGDGDKITVGEILENFVSASSDKSRSLEVFVKDELSLPQGSKIYDDTMRVVYKNGKGYIRYEGVKSGDLSKAYLRIEAKDDYVRAEIKSDAANEKSLLTAMELEHNITENKGILLHCSYIVYGDEAILFTAPSGTGKSTQAKLWQDTRGARLINGDRAAVMITKDGVVAAGIPYCGSSGVRINHTCKVRAVVYLSQSKVNTVIKLSGLRAFKRIWEGITLNIWHRNDVEKATDTVLEIAENVPVYHLSCVADETAVKALEEALDNN